MERCLLLLSFLLLSFAVGKGDGEGEEVSAEQECADKRECLEMELNAWLGAIKDPKEQFKGCGEGEDGPGGAADDGRRGKGGEPVLAVAESCDQSGAIWHYKYAGSKGKRKMFKGRGKLLFSKHSSPPHGYDHGMKSGICLLLSSSAADVSVIEGTFDGQAVLQGEGSISYHDGKVLRGTFVDGRLHGMARTYSPQRDKGTNLERTEKRLYSIAVYRRGVVDGGQWTVREDGTALFHPVGKEALTLAVVAAAVGDDPAQYVLGHLDDEDMMLGATKARLVSIEGEGCLKVPHLEEHGDKFDFDLEARSKVNAATAKFTRFFEVVADEKVSLSVHYGQHQLAPPDLATGRRLLEFLGREEKGDTFKVRTHDGLGLAVTDGGRRSGSNYPAGAHNIKILTDWRRRDVIPVAQEKKRAAEEAEKAKMDKLMENQDELMEKIWQEQQELRKARKQERMEEEKDKQEEQEESDEMDEELARSEDLLRNNETAGMSDEEYERHMDEFLPHDLLPVRPSAWADKIVKIHGIFDDDGLLQGHVVVTYGDGSTLEGVTVDGILHGIARHIDPPLKKGRRRRYVSHQVENIVIAVATGIVHVTEDLPREVNFVGSYRNGFIDGPGWKFLIGGTFLFGEMKKTLGFTTDHGAFINQDLENCYLGHFIDGKMMSGQASKIVGGFIDVSGVRVPKFSDPDPSSTTYRYVEQERGKLVDPTIPDTTEETWVYTAPSSLGPEAGEGLYAKRDIPENTVVAFFGGMRLSLSEWNSTKPMDPHYWMRVEGDNSVMYLPDQLGSNTAKYRATLAHKINHSFSRWNCMFHNLDHPRFGLIPAARVVDSVPEGTELLCMYEYNYHEASPWYQELWRRDIDADFVYGPFGHRGRKRNVSEPIAPSLSNGTLYSNFYRHAVEVLGLDPVT